MNSNFSHRSIFRLLFPLAIIALLLSGCDKELSEVSESKVMRKISPEEAQLIRSTNELAVNLLKAESALEKNTIFSPLSIGMALGMISNGVADQQRWKIEELTGMPATDVNEINKTFNQLISFFQLNQGQMDVRYANSIWFAFGNDVAEDFRSKVMAYYDAEVSELNFTKHLAAEHIAKWTSYKTDGLFNKLSVYIPKKKNEVLIVNAFGLETTWAQPTLTFRSEGLFKTKSAKTKKIHTLNWDGANAKWADDGDMTLLEIPMNNDLFYLSVIVPNEDMAFREFLSSFTIEDYHAMIDGAIDLKANITIPEVKLSGEVSFSRALAGMGLSDLFTQSAGLQKVFLNPEVRLSDIRHLARISFPESLQTENKRNSFANQKLQTISVGNSYIFFIRDRHTRTILFAGFVTDPSS